MKNIAAIKRNNRKIHARKFLSTPEGKAWLERKRGKVMDFLRRSTRGLLLTFVCYEI